jgi:tetratricopeptide (TPR) repeat protein
LERGETKEKIGFCFCRAAFQAEGPEEFEKRMASSVEAYEEASELFERSEDPKSHAKILFCRGMAAYGRSWIAGDSDGRKAMEDECRKSEKEALKIYEETGDKRSYGKTCNELLTCLYDRLWLVNDWQEQKNVLEEALEYGERAIKVLSEVGDEYELARAYYLLSYLLFLALDHLYESIEEQREGGEKCLEYAQKALEISEKIGDSYLIGMSNWALGDIIADQKGDFESSIGHTKKLLEHGTRIQDNLMMARAYASLAYVTWWKSITEEDTDKIRKGLHDSIQYAENAIAHFKRVLAYSVSARAYIPHIECYLYLAVDEINVEEKQSLLEKAVKVGREDIEEAKRSGSIDAKVFVLHCLSKALYSLSTAETKISEKRKLLVEASNRRDESINILLRSNPFSYWDQGAFFNYSALIIAELAKIETNKQKKVNLLRKAVQKMEECSRLCKIAAKALPQPRIFFYIGQYQDWFGGILKQLHSLTQEKEQLERAIVAYEAAIQAWEKADAHSRIAEAHWQMARLYNQLGNHSKSWAEFESASESYRFAADKMPHLKEIYTAYAMYMQAWSEIEKARSHHAEKRYGEAKEHYEKAADLHKLTERWSYLSPNYSAWAQLEEAEMLSRKEKTQEAKDLFQQATTLFAEAKKSINAKLEEIEGRDEKEMAVALVKASDIREEYCAARVVLEEAKILDKRGDHASSSRKYASAAEKFQKAINDMENESDRQEMRPILKLCQAWQVMTQAEAETSPDLYLEASKLFNEAKEYSTDNKSKVLALGHSRFCRALQAGTEFEDTRDMSLYSTAKTHLGAAVNYYVKAGLKSASEYAKATVRLFDAYMYVHKAETDTDPTKKAQYYKMAEKLLQTSAGSYMEAEHPEKSEEVRRLLENVKEERELAVSLVEVLHAPTIASTTVSFTTPTPTYEEAVGLERFEHADVQANLVSRAQEVKVGENVSLEIELTNAGKGLALLIRVEELIPAGFMIIEKPEVYRVEDSQLNMKGKRLPPLKMEDVKLVLRPLKKGVFHLKPKILYLDETGKYKFHEPKPLTIKVKEVVLSDRIATGTKELDSLLLGGIPENYTVALTAQPSDERESLIKNFLETGFQQGQTTFHVTTESTGLLDLLEKPESPFYLFLCNPNPKSPVPDHPNVYKLMSKTNLTNLNIALAQAYRSLQQPLESRKRVCVEIVSDILLNCGAKVTRKWLSELVTDLTAKGFTILAIINPLMHPSEELHAILDLFDGEISLCEDQTKAEAGKFLQVKKLLKKDYVKNPMPFRSE